jgi:hypothetical protein
MPTVRKNAYAVDPIGKSKDGKDQIQSLPRT